MFVWIAFFEGTGDNPIPFYGSTKEKALKQLMEALDSYDPEDFGHENFNTIYDELMEEKWVMYCGYKLYIEQVEYE